jgi:transcriptional regulator with XRE-family HTH domain
VNKSGVSQRRIADLVKMSQSEVSEILNGRQVQAYDVLVRVATGLEIPRGAMGLAYDDAGLVAEVDEEMKRRALLAAGSTALFGAPILGQLLHLPKPPAAPTPLPSRLGASDVAAINKLTESFRGIARAYGGCGEMVSPVALRSLALANVSGSELVQSEMKTALARLQNLAGWCCVDSGHYDMARTHFANAMELGDPVERASAFRHAGIQMIDQGAYNDGLKAYQLGAMSLHQVDDPEGLAWLHAESAVPYAAMDYPELAMDQLKMALEHQMSNRFDVADMDWLTSRVYWRLGKLYLAEQYAKSSVTAWAKEGTTRRDSVEADITLALIHAKAGEPDAAILVKRAVGGVAPLKSLRARRQLNELVVVLEARKDSTSQDLAHHAKKAAGMMV